MISLPSIPNGTRQIVIWIALSLSLTLLVGCGAGSSGYARVGDTELLDDGRIMIQDWENAASRLSESLLNEGVFGQQGHPSRIVISRFRNNTTENVDRNRLLRRIRIALSRADVAQVDMTKALGGIAEDPLAGEETAVREFLGGGPTPQPPDYSITVQLFEDRARVGRTTQVAYVFQMAVTDLNTGLAVWEEEERIVKQSTRSRFSL